MFENGKLEITSCGCRHWLNKEDQHHRLDGPSFDNSNCKWKETTGQLQGYCINGQDFTKEEHAKQVEQIKADALEEIEAMLFNCYAWLIVHRTHDCWGVPSARLTLLLSGYHALIDELTTYGVFKHAQDVLLETIMKRERND